MSSNLNMMRVSLEEIKTWTPAQLAQVGRFVLRLLAIEAGIFKDDARKAAFSRVSAYDQAVFLLDTIRPRQPDLLLEELREVATIDKYRAACVELSKVMRSIRRRA